jgi:general secretion pathway protein H
MRCARRATHRRGGAREAGFTLLELTVVVAILALAAAVVAPSLNRARPGLAVLAAAHELAASLRAARAAARAANVERVVTLDLDGRRYWAEGVVGPRAIAANVAVRLAVPEGERIGNASGRVRFFPDGSASGARVEIDDGRSAASVLVDWLSGDVRIERRS